MRTRVQQNLRAITAGASFHRRRCGTQQLHATRGKVVRNGQRRAYARFYATDSMMRRFPRRLDRNLAQWSIYNLFMRRAAATETPDLVPATTIEPDVAPFPPILPVKREWRAAVLESVGMTEQP